MPRSGSFFAVLLVGGDWAADLSSVAIDAGRKMAVTASTYAEAMQIAKAMRLSVVVTDLTLPDGDACDLLQAIAALYPLKGIALIENDNDADRQRALAAGFQAVLTKPVRRELLLAAMER